MFNTNSRYMLGNVIKLDESNIIQTSMRDKLQYDSRISDTTQHVVVDGETLHSIAQRYYGRSGAGAVFWWVIGDFQPEPIVDPTVKLEANTILYIPSLRYVQEELMGGDAGISETL